MENLFRKNIFVDKHNRTIYYDYKNKNAYVITNKDQTKFKIFSNRLLVTIIFVVLVNNYFLTTTATILLGIILYGYLTFYFFKKLIPTYSLVTNFNINENLNQNNNKNTNRNKEFLKSILYFTFAILLIINAHVENYNESNMILFISSYLISIFAILLSIKILQPLIRKEKQ